MCSTMGCESDMWQHGRQINGDAADTQTAAPKYLRGDGQADHLPGANVRLPVTMRLAVVLVACLFAAPVALADDNPADQGRLCDAEHQCPRADELQCVPWRDGKSTCEIVCITDQACPDIQHCARRGNLHICQPRSAPTRSHSSRAPKR